MFKKGQLVRIKNLHSLSVDGTGIIIDDKPSSENKYKVQVDQLTLWIHADRMQDEHEYIKNYRNSLDNSATYVSTTHRKGGWRAD